jgi:hypothetical protein
MHFIFPPYGYYGCGKKYGAVSLRNIYLTKIALGKITPMKARFESK